MDDKLTTAEETLRDVLAMIAAERTGTIARAHGWPQPDETQLREMTSTLVRAMTELVRGMRDPRAQVPSREEINEVIEGIAIGVLEKVMGPRTADVVH